MSFIVLPNLPNNYVTDVLVSGEISENSKFTLENLGITVHKTNPCHTLYNSVKYHPDMQFYHIGMDIAIAEPSQECYFREMLPTLNICSRKRVGSAYPYDIAYNSARVGQYLICNVAYTDKKIIDFAKKKGLEIINVKQGYAKCNICLIAENAIITSDAGIKTALGKFPVEVLLINDDNVLLKDFSHGFFGGASGKIAPDRLAVNGNIKYHKCYKEIVSFCKNYDVEVISLNNEYIEDIGSILPILEK